MQKRETEGEIMKNFFQENDEAANAAFYGFSNNGLIVEGSIAEPTRQDVTLTVTHKGEAAGIEFSLDNVIWEPYPAAGVVVTDNCTVYFRGFDESGNQISAAEYEVIGSFRKSRRLLRISLKLPINR